MSQFRFEIANLGVLLGKSPVTLRNWERKGFVQMPRIGVNRSLNIDDVKTIAKLAYEDGRISEDRMLIINEIMAMIATLEYPEESQ